MVAKPLMLLQPSFAAGKALIWLVNDSWLRSGRLALSRLMLTLEQARKEETLGLETGLALRSRVSTLAEAGKGKCAKHLPGVKTEAGSKKQEASNPGPRVAETYTPDGPTEVWALNVGGANGAWRVLNSLLDEAPPVLLLQETAFMPEEAKTFMSCAFRKGYQCFYSGCQVAGKKPQGGLWS